MIVTCFEREADAGPAGTSIDDRSFVRVARGAVVLIEGLGWWGGPSTEGKVYKEGGFAGRQSREEE